MKTQSTTLLFILALLSLSSCDGGNKQDLNKLNKTNTVKKPRRGDVRDAHGCLTSEGFVWSAAKDSCIHLWESGAELTATDRSEHVVFAVISNDKMQAEIFIPDDSSFIMHGQGNGTYTNDSLVLTETGKDYILKKGGKSIYQTMPAEPAQEVKKATRKRRRK
jgi:hypothetical protein